MSITSSAPKPAASHVAKASDSEAQERAPVARRLTLALVGVAQLVVVLNVSIVNSALPSIATGLGFRPISL
jgi:hypothetical protein